MDGNKKRKQMKTKKFEMNTNINAHIKVNLYTDMNNYIYYIHNYIFYALRAVQLSWICSKLTEPCLLPFGQVGLVCSPSGFASLHPYANPLLVPKVTKTATRFDTHILTKLNSSLRDSRT